MQKKLKLKLTQAVTDSDAPKLAMVDSDKGQTNFNASNDVIIDASMYLHDF